MATGLLLPNGKQAFTDGNGHPLAGGKVFFYQASTLTPKDTYQDPAMTILNTNPVILNARGEAVIFGLGAYRQILKDASDVTIWDTTIPDMLASVADAIAVFTASATVTVQTIAALKVLDKTQVKNATVQGYYARGDGGGGNYYLDIADTTTPSNGGTVIVATDGGRWKLATTTLMDVRQWGAKGDGATDDTTILQTAIAPGAGIRISTGTYLVTAPLVIDYTTNTPAGVTTSFLGYISKRYGVLGDSWANSILVANGTDFALKCLGSYPVTQNFSGNDSVENLTITNPVRNLPNTTNSGSSGILVKTKAYTDIKKYTAKNLKLGLQLDSVLTSKLEDILIEGCYQGIITNNSNAVSGPNSMIWSRVKVGNATSNGIVAEVGAASHFDTLTVEGNGTVATSSCGMVLTIPADQIAPVITFTQPYFELNAGVADLYIDNLGTSPATVIIEGGVFARAGANFTLTNIQAHSTGGGTVTVILKGCHFLSVSGYVPSAARPFWKTDSSVCKVIPDEYCTFNETTSLVGSKKYALTTPVLVDVNGTILGGDATSISCTRTSTGVYQFDCTAGFFGLTVLDYTVTANPADSAATGVSLVQSIRFQPLTASRFVLNCYVGTTPTNTPLSVQICGSKYSN